MKAPLKYFSPVNFLPLTLTSDNANSTIESLYTTALNLALIILYSPGEARSQPSTTFYIPLSCLPHTLAYLHSSLERENQKVKRPRKKWFTHTPAYTLLHAFFHSGAFDVYTLAYAAQSRVTWPRAFEPSRVARAEKPCVAQARAYLAMIFKCRERERKLARATIEFREATLFLCAVRTRAGGRNGITAAALF